MSSTEIRIETASIRQLQQLYNIEIQCFKNEAFSKKQISNLLTNYNSISLIAQLNNEIVGFIIGIIYFERDSAVGHILTIDVLPEHRKKGIGLRLMQTIEEIFKSKGAKASVLEVREDNVEALRLYQKCGYRKIGRLEGYYGNAHGAYLRKMLT